MNNIKSFSVFALLILLSVSCVPEQQALPDNYFMIQEGERPWVIAHGGAKDLFPENTMVAFEGSVEIGVDVLEIDLRLTQDSILVCHHDEDIDDMSDGTGYIYHYTYDELLQFNFGYGFKDLDGNYSYRDSAVKITRLEDVFDAYTDYYFVVEIKDNGDWGEQAGKELYRLIDEYSLQLQVIVASFNEETLEAFVKNSNGEVSVSASEKEATRFVISSKTLTGVFFRPEAVAIQVPMEQKGINIATKHVISSAHRHNMSIQYWTINDKEDMRLLIENGADGLMTDRPDLMWEVLEEMGWKVRGSKK